jgi:hypothetical protein
MSTLMRLLVAFSSSALYILMNSCWMSLMVSVANFIVNSCARDGPAESAAPVTTVKAATRARPR